ncbi:MlaD family protein [Nocardia sp. NPDC004582]
MKLGSLVSLGGIAGILVLGSGYLAIGVAGVDPMAEYTTATMVLGNTAGLATGSPILLSGVKVGDVTAVRDADSGAEVRFRVTGRYPIPVDSAVSIEQLSALGEPYVEFTPKSEGGPYLRDGQTISAERISRPRSIPEVARLMTQVLNQLDPAAMSRLTDTFGGALDGTDSAMADLGRSTALLAASLDSRLPEIAKTFTDMQTMADDIGWVATAAPAAAPPFVEFSVRVDQIAQALGRLFRAGGGPRMYLDENGLVPFLTRLTAWVDTAGPELAPLVPVLRPLVDDAAAQSPRIDLSRLISAALDGVGDDAVRLRIHLK